MSDQETVGTGTETSPARDDLGQQTDEALRERMFEREEEPAPVEEPETSEAPAEEEYEEVEVEASDQTLEEDDDDYDDVEEAIDESYEESEEEEQSTYTVKVDGKEVSVNLDELKRGYSGQSYINDQMRKVAENRKETEQLFAALSEERMQVQNAMQLLYDGSLTAPPVAPDESLFQSDPLAYLDAKMAYDKQAAEFQSRVSQLQQQVASQKEVEQHARHTFLAKEAELLQGYAPELFDENTGGTAKSELVSSAAESYGFTPEELAAVVDHRHVRVLMDAIKYNKLNSDSGKKRVEKKVNNKTVRSNKRRVNAEQASRRKMKQKLKQSGSIDDAVGLMFE
jgi:hypothetical protein